MQGTLAGAWYVYGVSANGYLNVRNSPGTGSPVIGRFAPGARPIYLFSGPRNASKATWVRVSLGSGRIGWVNLSYLRPLVTTTVVKGTPSSALKKAAQAASQGRTATAATSALFTTV